MSNVTLMPGGSILTPSAGDSPVFQPAPAAMQQLQWRVKKRLSSGLAQAEHFLEIAGFDRAPWLTVAFGLGILVWFVLPGTWHWASFCAVAAALIAGITGFLNENGRFPYLRQAILGIALMAMAGCATAWMKSVLTGRPAITGPWYGTVVGTVIGREDQPAEGRVRLLIRTRIDPAGDWIRVRINVPGEYDSADARAGSLIRVRVRLLPPAPPMLPGGYNFARYAWFEQLSATGSAQETVVVARAAGADDGLIEQARRQVADHVASRVAGSAGGVATALASGDRGAISKADEDAMRDAGLTHLLSVSGLHVSAATALAYLLTLRLLALSPWLALRVRLPLVAAGMSALTAIGYTVLTGSQVPTVRSCIGALLILAATAIGREPLSMRLLAVAAFLVLLFWPEAIVSPGFQMSFASVLAIVSFHSWEPMRAFAARRDEGLVRRLLRGGASLVLTGLVIELFLMPIALFHFHRGGVFGALANLIAIPLTEAVTIPAMALGFLLDTVHAGAPAWWLVGRSIQWVIGLAHLVAGMPGSVVRIPAFAGTGFAIFVFGALWLAIWQSRIRRWGLVPCLAGVILIVTARQPDLLVAGDGIHVGIVAEDGRSLILLGQTRSDFARENLTEIAGLTGPVQVIDDWPPALCNAAFCSFPLDRGGRHWQVLMVRGQQPAMVRDIAAACERSDIVIATRFLPPACHPRLLKVDRQSLARTGGLAVDLGAGTIVSVAELEGRHPWWRTGRSAP